MLVSHEHVEHVEVETKHAKHASKLASKSFVHTVMISIVRGLYLSDTLVRWNSSIHDKKIYMYSHI